jgi:hypothetical protein
VRGAITQEALVGISGFLVTLRSCGRLTKIKEVIGFVWIDRCRLAQTDDAREHAILVVVNHGQPGNGHRLIFIESQSGPKFLDGQTEIACRENR